MKSFKYIALIGLLCAGLSSMARANLTFLGTQTLDNANPETELAKFIELAPEHSDASVCASITAPFEDAVFTIEVVNATQIRVTFDLTGTGQVVCGFSVKDGDGTIANFYSVSADQGVANSFLLTVPGNGANALSQLTVFCCAGGAVPDGGTTVMLLGAALGALGVVRRYLSS